MILLHDLQVNSMNEEFPRTDSREQCAGSHEELDVTVEDAAARDGSWDGSVGLRARRRLSRLGLDAINTMIVMADVRAQDQPLIFANGYFLEFTGYSADEIVGRNCRFLQRRADGTEDNDQTGLAKIRRAIKSGTATRALLRNYRKDGVMFWNELFLSPVFDDHGRLTHMIGVQNNVSDRMNAAEDRHLLHSVVQDNEDAMLIETAGRGDQPGRVTHVNRAFTAMTGLESGLIVGQDSAAVLSVLLGRSAYHSVENTLAQRQRYLGDVALRPRGASTLHARYAVTPIRSDENRIVQWCHVFRDITDQRQLEQDVVDIQSYEQSRLARDLHDSVAQDLTAAALTCTHLREKIKDPDIKLSLTSIFEDIRDAAHQARSIAHGLMPIDVGAHGLTSSLAMLARRTQDHGLAVCEFHASTDRPLADAQHELHLYHVAREAVSNAIRHGHAKRVSIELSTNEKVGSLVITDDGQGLPDDRVANGIGVRTMRSRARLLGGDLAIDNRPDRGVEVRCDFPYFPRLEHDVLVTQPRELQP